MTIQWFPGHMHKARVQMAEILPKVDLVMELLDARIPYSSQNPMLAELRGSKPCLKLLSKSDLADPAGTAQWRSFLERDQSVRALSITTQDRQQIRQLKRHCLELFPEQTGVGKQVTAMVAGIPNVGKSTLINILAGRKVAKTGNEPAVTKGQQRIRLSQDLMLLDTPGVLWPNLENRHSGYRLAAIGSIKDTAMEYEDVAYFMSGFLLSAYPERLQERYGIESLPSEPVDLLDAIGKKRGCLNKRGVIDYERVARILLTELRGGKLGPLTLETPEMMQQEIAEVAAEREQKTAAKAARDAQRKQRFKSRQKGQ